MALTPAEKQRRYRNRVKTKQDAAPDLSSEAVTRSFAEFMKNDGEAQFVASFMRETLASVGLQCPDFEKDEDPEWDPAWGSRNTGALGLATRTVDAFVDCASHLAETINRFKLAEIEAAITRLQATQPASPDAYKANLAEAVRLNQVKAKLLREVRRNFKPTQVKGES